MDIFNELQAEGVDASMQEEILLYLETPTAPLEKA